MCFWFWDCWIQYNWNFCLCLYFFLFFLGFLDDFLVQDPIAELENGFLGRGICVCFIFGYWIFGSFAFNIVGFMLLRWGLFMILFLPVGASYSLLFIFYFYLCLSCFVRFWFWVCSLYCDYDSVLAGNGEDNFSCQLLCSGYICLPLMAHWNIVPFFAFQLHMPIQYLDSFCK